MTEKRRLYLATYTLKNRQKIAAYHRKYYLEKRDRFLQTSKKYRLENPDKVSQVKKDWYKKNFDLVSLKKKAYRAAHTEEHYLRDKVYREKNREILLVKQAARRKKRFKSDIQYKIRLALRGRISMAVRRGTKGGSAVRDLGCTIGELKMYLEGQFKDGMTWDNWSVRGWHIDHKVPLAFFDLTDREQFLKAVHYTNLQPLWALVNLRKSAKIL